MENGLVNGHEPSPDPPPGVQRFADIPKAIDIPVSGGDVDEAVEVNLEELLDDPTELCTLLENENVTTGYWTTIALAYAKANKIDTAIEIVNKGLDSVGRANSTEKLGLFNCLCWMYLMRSRDAPRTKLDTRADPDVKTKDHYLRAATATLNDASRISPAYPPLHLARGVLSLLRAALLADQSEKSEALRQAIRAFDDSARSSGGRNMMAVLGRARAMFSLGKYADALKGYQQVLERSPDLSDPDPRIGIGCCFWALGHKDDAQVAWQRALDIRPDSKIANILLGLYNLNSSAQFTTTDPQFAPLYKKAMVEYTQRAFKLDNDLPLACATFGNYFLARRSMSYVDKLARKAVELTDVSAIASDGWYLLARKEQYGDELHRANDYYVRADQARGGDDRGYLPAKFGSAQIKVLQQDIDGAKFRLEKIIQQTKNVEAMTLLGTLWAEDAFTGRAGATREEIDNATRRAISLLENVRMAWKDPKRNTQPDSSVLLNLARLYEADNVDKSLQCLQQVEQMEIDDLPENVKTVNSEDEAVKLAIMREHLSPQLLNNIACFHYQAERLGEARDYFQTALNACVKASDKDASIDTDALVTTISFNLGRTYEAENMLDEAKQVYEELLARHADYTDARMRLTYIALRQNPAEEGPKSMAQLYESDSMNLEVRSLYGWYLRKAKRKTPNIAEDQEQRHFKHTLQGHDKHDRYSLTGMGNLYLATAREMRRETDQEKERRRKMYERAVEFFDKALQLDPRNAYAAQGIGIAVVEDKKDYSTALQIFSKVRETIKDPSVFVNLGHVYCELKQFSRAVENYEAALVKDRARDPQILACLGRAWLLRGKQEKSAQAMKTSLEYSQRALQAAPDQVHFKFNIAFVQIQIAQLLHNLPESHRTLEEVQAAADGLDEAIESFSAIAKSPNPPFPRHDIEQRANMGRNTMRRQLERAIQSQREYEGRNAARLQQAREQREVEMAKREEEKRRAEEELEAQRRKVAEERREMAERDRRLAELRAEKEKEEEERKKDEDMDVDDEKGGGEKRKRTSKRATTGVSKRRRKAATAADSDVDGTDGLEDTPLASGDDQPRQKKKRKLERRSAGRSSKYKSEEFIVDSDEDEDGIDGREDGLDATPAPDSDVEAMLENNAGGGSDAEEGGAPVSAAPRRKANRIIDDDDDDDDEGQAAATAVNGTNAADVSGDSE